MGDRMISKAHTGPLSLPHLSSTLASVGSALAHARSAPPAPPNKGVGCGKFGPRRASRTCPHLSTPWSGKVLLQHLPRQQE
jgi:hypothetical protein